MILKFVIFGSWILRNIRLYFVGLKFWIVFLFVMVIVILCFIFLSNEWVIVILSLMFLIMKIFSLVCGFCGLILIGVLVNKGIWIVMVKVLLKFFLLLMLILLFINLINWCDMVKLMLVFIVCKLFLFDLIW